MYYNILDLTGRHQPSKKALGPFFNVLRLLMASELQYEEYKFSSDERKQLAGEVKFKCSGVDNRVKLMRITA